MTSIQIPKTPPTLDIEKLLGQATPRPIEMHVGWDVAGYPVFYIHGLSGEDKRDVEKLNAICQLIVLAVNALPAFLKLREVATTALSVGEIKFKTCVLSSQVNDQITNALSEVDAALGLSTKPRRQEPFDTYFDDIKNTPHLRLRHSEDE